MNVLFVIHYPVFGGPHNRALRLAVPLSVRGFTTVVVVPDEQGNAAERLRAGGVEVRTMRLHRLRATTDPRALIGLLISLPAEVGQLRRLIRDEGIDLVQIGGLVNPHAAIAARLEHVPVVWQLLDTRAPRFVSMAAMVWVRELADVVMSTGLAVAKAHPGYSAIADRTIPFFSPVELERFLPRPEIRAEVRAEWGIPATALVVGCVANINPQKGITDLVRAFARVRSQTKDARLVLVGAEYATHAKYSGAVRVQMALDQLVEGRDVIFVGERNDVERQLAGMDVMALAAVPRSEGVTTAVLEAMASGLPVVVTDVGALREAVDDLRSGFVVPASDTDAFAAALARLLGDPALRERMGLAARQIAERRFSVNTSSDTHIRAYKQALARRGKVARAPTLRTERPPDPSSSGHLVGGTRVFLDDLGLAEHDEIEHGHGSAHRDAQARYFDRPNEEAFEIDRPHRTPRFYRFLLSEKFRLAIDPIRRHLVGASALTVCGGSGMDAEFLARAGALVTTSDLSLGAATRARIRSERYGVEIQSIVADVEHLPYGDQSVDLVAVHDGLHHLADPFPGLAEMARVARRWVVVTEPAQASLTRLAIRLGMALETEEAGNRVARMEPAQVAAFLEARGFDVLRAERYAMYYPHHPGRMFRVLSRPFVFPFVVVGWRLANNLVGRFGNKMVVIAERHQPATASDSPGEE